MGLPTVAPMARSTHVIGEYENAGGRNVPGRLTLNGEPAPAGAEFYARGDLKFQEIFSHGPQPCASACSATRAWPVDATRVRMLPRDALRTEYRRSGQGEHFRPPPPGHVEMEPRDVRMDDEVMPGPEQRDDDRIVEDELFDPTGQIRIPRTGELVQERPTVPRHRSSR